MSREELEKRLAELREEFRGQLGDRLDDITAAWRTLREAGWNDGDAETLERLAHSLTGAAATFGFEAVSAAARALERAVAALRKGATTPRAADLKVVAECVEALEAASSK